MPNRMSKKITFKVHEEHEESSIRSVSLIGRWLVKEKLDDVGLYPRGSEFNIAMGSDGSFYVFIEKLGSQGFFYFSIHNTYNKLKNSGDLTPGIISILEEELGIYGEEEYSFEE